MDKLKPCPFCGNQMDERENGTLTHFIGPKRDKCILGGIIFKHGGWNNRPIEDALTARKYLEQP